MDDQVPVREDGGLARVVAELRQWHVFRVAAAYAVGAWLLVQVVATVGPAFDLPNWVLRAVVLGTIAGFLATMAFMLFRPRLAGNGRVPKYLSRRTRLVAGTAVLIIAAGAAFFSIRSIGAPQQVSLAVLPFTDLSPARDKAYFAEGIAEEILSTLAAERGIKVLGRTSARQIERNPDPQAMRASLGVTHLLEGSTRTAGQMMRVNVRLVDTSDGSQVWEEEYDGVLADVFAVQDKIAGAVVRRLRGTLFGTAARAVTPTAVDGYETYLAARALLRENKREPMVRAWQMARQLVEAQPDFARGHAIYAEATDLLTEDRFGYGTIPPHKSQPIVLAHARKAIELAPKRAEGYAALGLALPSHESIAPYRRALTLDPSRADVRVRLSLALNVLGRQDEAFEQLRLAAETDPLSASIINRYTQMLASSGRAAEAMRAIDLFERRGGAKAQAWRFRANTYRYVGDESRHVAARLMALRIDPGLPYQHEWLAQSYHLLGFGDQARTLLPKLSSYYQMFIGDDRGALREALAADGPQAWAANGLNLAIFSLARARDWEAIVRFYDARPPGHRDQCLSAARFAPFLVIALRQRGRAGEAERLLDCTQGNVAAELAMRHRAPDDVPGELEMLQASLLALRRDRRALDWLEKAVRREWLGQYYSSQLADWPQFDALRADPRYAAVQQRIDAVIARERAEVLAGK